jgi:hypothetical protein
MDADYHIYSLLTTEVVCKYFQVFHIIMFSKEKEGLNLPQSSANLNSGRRKCYG